MGISAGLSAKEGRKFGFTVGTAFLVLGAVTLWRGRDTVAAVLGALGGLLIVSGLVLPRSLGPVQAAWMKMAHAIAQVTTPVFMGVVYFVVLTPIGLVMRLIGRNPMESNRSAETVWVSRGDDRASDLRRQF